MLSPIAILIVDDDDVSRLVLGHQLRSLGHEVVDAASAAKALEILADCRVDLIISDHEMPGMSGLEFRLLLGPDLDVPFVLLTGFADADELDGEADGLTMTSAFLTKPVSSFALETVLAQLLTETSGVEPA